MGFLTILLIESCEELEPVNPADPNHTLRAPTILSVSSITDTRINVTWRDNEEHTQEFIIYRKTNGASSFDSIGFVPKDVLSYNDTSCILGITYSYSVTSKVKSNQSAFSNEWATATIFPAPPRVSISTVSGTAVKIVWIDSCDFESGYRIERESGAGYKQIGEVSQNITTFTDSLVNFVTEYYYRVAGYTNSNISAYTYSSSAYVPIPAPSNLVAEPNSKTSIRLSWTDNCDFEAGFIIHRDSGTGYEILETLGAGIIEYIDENVKENISYTYVVDVFDQNSNFGRSNATTIDFPNISSYFVPSQYSDISSAIEVASTGDSIIIEEGIYYEEISVSKSITIGSEYLLTGDSLDIMNTIIDGTGSFTQFNISGAVSIVGLSIINGGTSGSILCNGVINVDHCMITQSIGNGFIIENGSIVSVGYSDINTIQRSGIAFNGDNISLSIIGSSFYDNYSAIDNHGRGDNSIITMEGSTVSGSELSINISNASNIQLDLRNCEISASTSALYMKNSGTLSFEDVRIYDCNNSQSNLESIVFIRDVSEVSFKGCTFYGNETERLIYSESPIYWNSCRISDNTSTSQFLLYGGSYYNCIIENNSCSEYVVAGSFENSVIYGNSSNGVFFSGSGPIVNSIIWNNSGGANYTGTNALYSNIQEAVTGIGNLSTDPFFSDGDYHLAEDSPCKDSGNPSPSYNDVDGSRNDMGAYGGPGGEW
jgi:hypothetical protein